MSETQPANVMLGMKIPASLDIELSEAASALNLTKSAIGRMALQKGLPFVVGRLEKIVPTPTPIFPAASGGDQCLPCGASK